MSAIATEVIDVKDVRHKSGHRLEIAFSDGSTREVDFGPFLEASQHPDVRSYLSMEKFLQFNVEDGMLHWNDFDLVFPVADLHAGRIN